jgi:AcrR family transcriptional regulator
MNTRKPRVSSTGPSGQGDHVSTAGAAPILDDEAGYRLVGPPSALGADEAALLPPSATADGTLRRMLVSALTLFGARGYHAVPVREIARGAGVRASSMYEHRASKEDLLLDLMIVGHEEHHRWLAEAVAAADATPPARVVAYMDAHVRFHATYRMLARVCNRELGALSPERLQPVMAVRQASVELLMDVLRDGQQAGVFAVPDIYLAAAALGAMGLRVAEWYTPAADISVDALAGTYSQFALRLVGCRET